MTTKFNQDMYAKIRSNKNEPLSNLGKRTVCVVEKGVSVTPAAPGTETMRIASLAISVEEITPIRKKPRVANKGKEKADLRLSSIWDDAESIVARAHEVITTEDLKVFSSTPPNKIVGRHIHKLVQVMYLCNFILSFLFFLHRPNNFFSSVGGEFSYHLGVSYSRGKGWVHGVLGGGFGGRKLQIEEGFDSCHG